MTTPTPGPRQTVDRACHPTLGEGVAVYDHGPAYFAADSGEVVQMQRISIGGSGVGGSYLNATTLDGERIRLDTTGRERGVVHERVVSQAHGAGWLLSGISPDTRRATRYRFEPDSWQEMDLLVAGWWVGLPSDDPFGKNWRKEWTKEEIARRRDGGWLTLQVVDGSFFVYRREEDAMADIAAAAHVAAPEQMGLPL